MQIDVAQTIHAAVLAAQPAQQTAMTDAEASKAQTPQGDTVTISEKAKQLSKDSADKKDGDAAAAAVQGTGTTVTSSVAVSDLQATKTNVSKVKAKLEDAKQQAETDPSKSGDVATLKAKLDNLNREVKKEQLKMYA